MSGLSCRAGEPDRADSNSWPRLQHTQRSGGKPHHGRGSLARTTEVTFVDLRETGVKPWIVG